MVRKLRTVHDCCSRDLESNPCGTEDLLHSHLLRAIKEGPVTRSPKVGRNDLCICGSRKKFKKCCLPDGHHVKDSPRPPALVGSYVGKQRHVIDYGPPNLAFTELVEATGAFRLDSSLSEIRRHSHRLLSLEERWVDVGSQNVLATHAALATVARAVLLFEGQRGTMGLDADGLSLLLRMYWRLGEPGALGGSGPREVKPKDEELELRLSRMMFLESPWQKERCNMLPRALLLFDLLTSHLSPKDHASLTCFVRDELGMDLYDFILVGFAAWVYAGRHSGLLGEHALAKYVEAIPIFSDRIDSEKIGRFLQVTATTPAQFARAAGNWRQKEVKRSGSMKYAFNPLFKFPIVQLDDPVRLNGTVHEYIEPIDWLTLEAVAHGNYFRLIDRRDGSLGKAFGHVFQTYIGKLIDEGLVGRRAVLLPEEQYNFQAQPYDSADWVLLEGEEATIIECKAANLRMRGKEGESYEEYGNEMDELVKAVKQSFRFETHVRSAPERWPQLSSARRFHHLVVVYDPQHLGNSVMRRAAESHFEGIPGLWNVIDVADFEFLFDTLRRCSLGEILSTKESRDDWYKMDFHEFIPHAFSFDPEYRHPLLRSVWSKYFDFDSLISERIAGK
jgi:hypothetical protein